jgi:hypothetical protein
MKPLLFCYYRKNKTTSGFAAGDLADPHGTHEVCLNTILAAMKQLKSQSYMLVVVVSRCLV